MCIVLFANLHLPHLEKSFAPPKLFRPHTPMHIGNPNLNSKVPCSAKDFLDIIDEPRKTNGDKRHPCFTPQLQIVLLHPNSCTDSTDSCFSVTVHDFIVCRKSPQFDRLM